MAIDKENGVYSVPQVQALADSLLFRAGYRANTTRILEVVDLRGSYTAKALGWSAMAVSARVQSPRYVSGDLRNDIDITLKGDMPMAGAQDWLYGIEGSVNPGFHTTLPHTFEGDITSIIGQDLELIAHAIDTGNTRIFADPNRAVLESKGYDENIGYRQVLRAS